MEDRRRQGEYAVRSEFLDEREVVRVVWRLYVEEQRPVRRYDDVSGVTQVIEKAPPPFVEPALVVPEREQPSEGSLHESRRRAEAGDPRPLKHLGGGLRPLGVARRDRRVAQTLSLPEVVFPERVDDDGTIDERRSADVAIGSDKVAVGFIGDERRSIPEVVLRVLQDGPQSGELI